MESRTKFTDAYFLKIYCLAIKVGATVAAAEIVME